MSERDKVAVRVPKLVDCARCGGTHEDIVFLRFVVAVKAFGEAIFTHWASCPSTGDPILMVPQGGET